MKSEYETQMAMAEGSVAKEPGLQAPLVECNHMLRSNIERIAKIKAVITDAHSRLLGTKPESADKGAARESRPGEVGVLQDSLNDLGGVIHLLEAEVEDFTSSI